MSSWWPNACTNATTSPSWKTGTVTHRSGRCPIPPSDRYTSLWKYTSPGPHGLDREVPHHRVDQRRVRPPGQLAQPAVVDAGPEVVLVADHRRPGRAADLVLHLGLDRGEGALDDLQQHRVDVGHLPSSRRNTSEPRRSTAATTPGGTGSGRAVLLDHARSADDVPGPEVGPGDDRHVLPPAVEPHPPARARPPATPALGDRRERRRGQRPDPGEPHVHPLDAVLGPVAVAVAVQPLVLVVEPGQHRRAEVGVDRPGRHGHPDLERLAVVAQVGGPQEPLAGGVEPLGGQRGGGSSLHLGVHSGERGGVEAGMAGDERAHVVQPDVDGEQAEGAQVAGVRRDDRRRQAQHVQQPAGLERARAAEGAQRQVPDVDPPAYRHLAYGVGLVPGRDLQDALGARLGRQAQLAGQRPDAGPGGLGVERDLAAQQVVGDAPERQRRIGQGGLGAASAVAERPRVGAGRAGPDLERPLRRHPGDRPAARTHGHDVDHRHLGREPADGGLGGEGRRPGPDHGHVGRGAAAVERDHVVEPRGVGDGGGAERTGRRSGQHGRDRRPRHLGRRGDPAVRLHDQERHPRAGPLGDPAAQALDVAGDDRLHEGVDQRGDRALVLAVLAQHVRADRHRALRVLGREQVPHPLLVRGVGVGVQQADADRGDAVVAEPAGLGHDRLLVQRPQDRAGRVEPLGHLPDQVEGHDAVGLHPEVRVAVAVGHALATDLQQVPEAGRRQEPQPGDLALEQRVGGDGRAVQHGPHLAPAGAGGGQRLVGAGQEPDRGVAAASRVSWWR